jgi:uncharacterized protein (TIGR02246 family)
MRWLQLLALGGLATACAYRAPALAQHPPYAPADTLPEAVVQRFVDAANARDAAAMSALVAPEAVFQRFPGGEVMAEGRDAVHALYVQLLPRLASGSRITVESRIVEGNLVIDHEHFTVTPVEHRRATWIYQVRGGRIHRAWRLDGEPAAAP